MTHSNHKYAILEGEARETILQQLKKEKLHQQQTFNKFFQRTVLENGGNHLATLN